MSGMNEIQRSLSILQAVPLAGPICVSPIKAGVSLAQIIAGVAVTVFSLALSPFFSREFGCGKAAMEGLSMAGDGVLSFSYSIVNMLSLGIIGMVAELCIALQSGDRNLSHGW